MTNTYSSRQRVALGLQQPTGAWTNGFIYDPAKRLTNVTSQAGTFSYNYLTPINYQPSTINLPNTSYITNRYDTVARLLETDLRKNDTTVLDSYTYLYNLAGQRSNLTRSDSSTVGYVYDKIGQLKVADSSVNTEDRGYTYDAAWNVNWVTNNGTAGQYTVNSLNELTAAPSPTGSQIYDDNGNLFASRSATWSYGYDAENRLIQQIRPGGAEGYGEQTIFIYDGLGRLRIRQESHKHCEDPETLPQGIIDPDGGGVGGLNCWWILDSEVHYIYDGWRVIQERDDSNTPLVSYTRGRDLSGSMEGAGGIGGLLARSDGYSSGNWTSHNFYFADGNGNITYLVNSSQAGVAAYRYDPFGNTISSSGSLASANTYRFSSKEIHVNSGLYYYGYRFYDSGTERWINRDPLGERGGINLYAFVRNDVVDGYDPDGHKGVLGRRDRSSCAFWDKKKSDCNACTAAYAQAAALVCRLAGESPWEQCQRWCLQVSYTTGGQTCTSGDSLAAFMAITAARYAACAAACAADTK